VIRVHPGQSQLLGRGPQEVQRRVDPAETKAAGGGLGDAGEVGELKAFEDGDQVRVVDALEPVALVQVARLFGHPDRSRDPDRTCDALAHLSLHGLLDSETDALRSEPDQVWRSDQVHRGFVDRHPEHVRAVPFQDFHQPIGDGAVARRVGLHDKDSRIDGFGLEDLHPGLDAEVSRLAGRGDYRGRIGGVGGDRQWPAPEAWVVLLLDRGEGAVEVDDQGGGGGGIKAQLRQSHDQTDVRIGGASSVGFATDEEGGAGHHEDREHQQQDGDIDRRRCEHQPVVG